MGVAPTEYRPHEACIEVAAQSITVYKVGMAPIGYRAHEACIEVARRSTTIYKVGVAYIGIVLPCTYLLYL